MTDSTPTAWQVDGTSLQTLCMNVESLAPKYGVPGLRGSDISIAYKRGKRWRPKTADSRTVSLGMWVTGQTAAGLKPTNGMERQFHENMTALQRLLWNDGTRQVHLKKRWVDPTTGVVTAATALAEVQPFQPEMRGPYSAKMVVDFLLADPYFYGSVQEITLAKDVPATINVAGDIPTSRITFTANGQLTSPQVTNETPNPDVWMKVGTAIASGDSVFLDVEGFTAVRQSDDANIVGAVTRSGARQWMALLPGANVLTLTASAGSGDVDMTYAAAYL